MSYTIRIPKKLINVALPINLINEKVAKTRLSNSGKEIALDLSNRSANFPDSVYNAILFAQLVNDPSWKWYIDHPDKIPPRNNQWVRERERLTQLMKDILYMNKLNRDYIIERAKKAIGKSWEETCDINIDHPEFFKYFDKNKLPSFYDPFAGNAAISKGAKLFGLKTFASDADPIFVLGYKAVIEFPTVSKSTVCITKNGKTKKNNPKSKNSISDEVAHYGDLLLKLLKKDISHLYPCIRITNEIAKKHECLKTKIGENFPIEAWFWTRTIKSPNLCNKYTPISETNLLSIIQSTDNENYQVYFEPKLENNAISYLINYKHTKKTISNRSSMEKKQLIRCLFSNRLIPEDYIRFEAESGRLGDDLVAVSIFCDKERIFLPVDNEQRKALKRVNDSKLDLPSNVNDVLNIETSESIMNYFLKFLNNRQWAVLRSLIVNLHKILDEMDNTSKHSIQSKQAIAIYLTHSIIKYTELGSRHATWHKDLNSVMKIPTNNLNHKLWNYVEVSPFSSKNQYFENTIRQICKYIINNLSENEGKMFITGSSQSKFINNSVFSTSVFEDNMRYNSDVIDFDHILFGISLAPIFPNLINLEASLDTSIDEIGNKTLLHQTDLKLQKEEIKRLNGKLTKNSSPAYPATIYYTFAKDELSEFPIGSKLTEFEKFVSNLVKSGWIVTNIWPLRLRINNLFKKNRNNSNHTSNTILILCSPREKHAGFTTTNSFIRELTSELVQCLNDLIWTDGRNGEKTVPMDMPQILLGHGLSILTKYDAIYEPDGKELNTHTAMKIINSIVFENDFDNITKFLVRWFELNGWEPGNWSAADSLALSNKTDLDRLKNISLIQEVEQKIKILHWGEYKKLSSIDKNTNMTGWEGLHRLLFVYLNKGVRSAQSFIEKFELDKNMTYHLLYKLVVICNRLKRNEDSENYRQLLDEWKLLESR